MKMKPGLKKDLYSQVRSFYQNVNNPFINMKQIEALPCPQPLQSTNDHKYNLQKVEQGQLLLKCINKMPEQMD